MTTKHTPLPWRVGRNSTDYCVFHGDEKFVADCDTSDDMEGTDEDIANAAIIVRAVNSHAALVDAVKTLSLVLKAACSDSRGAVADALEKADAALSLASEG